MQQTTYQIKLVLKGSKPLIWRRLLIPSAILLSDLHRIIQTTMGWTNSHLHQFIKDRLYYQEQMDDNDLWDEELDVDYRSTKLADLLRKEKERIIYEYDFGDSWEHDVILEKILPAGDGAEYPVCLDGKLNCPPEDCGGIWGYYGMLEILKHPDHEEYDDYIEWLGGEFDPDYFDRNKVNYLLKEDNYGCIDFF